MEDRHCDCPQRLQLFLLAWMVALLVGIVPSAQLAEAGQEESIQELRARAEAGNVDAQGELGMRYYRGMDTVQDFSEARVWLLKTAEQRHTRALFTPGLMNDHGRGVRRNHLQAYIWFNLAAAYAAADDAKERALFTMNRDGQLGTLTPEQQAEGQRLAREWFEAHPPE